MGGLSYGGYLTVIFSLFQVGLSTRFYRLLLQFNEKIVKYESMKPNQEKYEQLAKASKKIMHQNVTRIN